MFSIAIVYDARVPPSDDLIKNYWLNNDDDTLMHGVNIFAADDVDKSALLVKRILNGWVMVYASGRWRVHGLRDGERAGGREFGNL